jgi:MarR family transcriptional regulator, lower aerobic nicotinate degradation pathway regulator
MYQLFPRLRESAVLVTGDLADHEKWQLLYLLQKLDHFHRPIFMEHRDADLDTLRQRVP